MSSIIIDKENECDTSYIELIASKLFFHNKITAKYLIAIHELIGAPKEN